MRIELHIGRVVLEGVSPRDAARVRAALTAELGELLTRAPITPAASHRVRRAAAAPLSPVSDPAALGRGIAQAVHGSLRPSQGGGR
ncbi:hypothetical protein STRCI_001101 [Streptomyces cinnabarinus]|uniref:Uncharacterized protein n=1 Tax=Streptomyces cinnabarinus TaxID=67287 RepID=A0ABY7K679_9ACTN|nr:hypothetical protein [Streptomyces cinnabarinus]WAZ20011.1 hypothetical protein STRCI_001101 [Streptomyces cinnabarinus]